MEAAVEGDGDATLIAAFAVSKGGVVIKHIFLNAPPPELTRRNGSAAEEEEDPPVTVGRHPDCHILVDHPSVSRFHLELRARRRQRRITVTDLSSGKTPRVLHPSISSGFEYGRGFVRVYLKPPYFSSISLQALAPENKKWWTCPDSVLDHTDVGVNMRFFSPVVGL
jgi:hypothetical protein